MKNFLSHALRIIFGGLMLCLAGVDFCVERDEKFVWSFGSPTTPVIQMARRFLYLCHPVFEKFTHESVGKDSDRIQPNFDFPGFKF